MTEWTGEQVSRLLGTSAHSGLRFTSVGTDTRTLEPGALFVALAGERFDGHDFLEQAGARGAVGAVVRRDTAAVRGLALFEVEDPLAALGVLARERRRAITGPVVAVTGTNGKTATKELLARALVTRWRVHATRANRNNLIGVPLTLLDAPENAEALVVEAGASVPGEIARLRAIIEPTVAVITNVSEGHTEGFGSLERALEEKASLADGVPLAVVGPMPPALAGAVRGRAGRVVVAGLTEPAELRPDAWQLDDAARVELTLGGAVIRLPLIGTHQAENAMLALAVARELGLDLADVARAMATVALPPGRCQVLRCGDLVVLHDAYNANPGSLEASLVTAEALRQGRPLVVVLGTMLELGEASEALHARMADRVLEFGPMLVAAVGAFVPAFARHRDRLGARLVTADDPDTLGARLVERLAGHELVMLKASRGVRLERALRHLLPDAETPCSTTS